MDVVGASHDRARRRRLQLLLGLDRAPLALGDDSEEATLLDHRDDARHGAGGSDVRLAESGPVARPADDAGVDHSGGPKILHIGRAPGELGRDVHARNILANRAVAPRTQRGARTGVHGKVQFRSEFGVGEGAPVRRAHRGLAS